MPGNQWEGSSFDEIMEQASRKLGIKKAVSDWAENMFENERILNLEETLWNS